jgi:hypothetical protein
MRGENWTASDFAITTVTDIIYVAFVFLSAASIFSAQRYLKYNTKLNIVNTEPRRKCRTTTVDVAS